MTGLIILDPYLRQRAGHYAEYDFSLREAAIQTGHDVTIYAHKDWQGEGAVPHFGRLPSAHSAGHAALSSLPSKLRKIVFPPARFVYRQLSRKTNAFAEEVSLLDLPDDAVLLCPSASYRDAADCLARWPDGNWRFVLRQKPQNKGDWAALQRMPLSNALLTDTQDLADWLAGQGQKTRVIPIPMSVPSFVYDDPEPHSVFTFVLLGPARMEKGIALMPALVKALRGRARFVIQTTLVQGQAPEPEAEHAIAALKKLQGEHLVLIDGDISNDEFYKYICEASCVLLPYDRTRYKERSSGLLVQSYLCGRPCIVPEDTWMADQGPAFLRYTIWQEDLLKTCKTVMAKHTDMREFTKGWRTQHSAHNTLQAIFSN